MPGSLLGCLVWAQKMLLSRTKKGEKSLLFYFGEIWGSAANGGKGKAIVEASAV